MNVGAKSWERISIFLSEKDVLQLLFQFGSFIVSFLGLIVVIIKLNDKK